MMDCNQHMIVITTEGVVKEETVPVDPTVTPLMENKSQPSTEEILKLDEGNIWQQELVSMAASVEAENESVTICFQTTRHIVSAWERMRTAMSMTNAQLLESLLKLCEEKAPQLFCSVCQSTLTHFCTKCCPLVNATLQTSSTSLVSAISRDTDEEAGEDEEGCSSDDFVPVAVIGSQCSKVDNHNRAVGNTSTLIDVSSCCSKHNTNSKHASEDIATQKDVSSLSSKRDNSITFRDIMTRNDVSLDCKSNNSSCVGDNSTLISHFDSGMDEDDSKWANMNEKKLVKCVWCDVSWSSMRDLYTHLSVHTTVSWQQKNVVKHNTANKMTHPKPSNPGTSPKRRSSERLRRVSAWHEDAAAETKTPSLRLQNAKEESVKKESVLIAEEQENDKVLDRKSELYFCLQCGASYKNVFMFSMHLQKKHIQKKAFQCCRCEATFDSTKMLWDHVQVHLLDQGMKEDQVIKTGDYLCAVCHKRFNYLGHLVNHAARHPGENVFFCSYCESSFRLVADYTGHTCLSRGSLDSIQSQGRAPKERTYNNEGVTVSEIAQHDVCADTEVPKTQAPKPMIETTASKESLSPIENKKSQTGINFECPDCSAVFKFSSGLRKHYQKHSGQNAFSCPDCTLTFNSKTKLHAHQEEVHWKSMPIMCRICGKIVKSLLALEAHEILHTDALPFSCQYCQERFKNSAALNRHCRKHKGMEYRCNLCQSSFYSFTQYSNHKQSHSQVKSYLCTTCGEAFTQQQKLNSHMAKHSPAQFVCEQCGKAFHEKGSHRMHMKTHLKVKPFQCHTCGKGFVAKNKMQLHISRVHLCLKPHKCMICNISYATPSRLNEHMRAAHTSERPYKCPKCGKSFAKSGCRQAHLRTHCKRQVSEMETESIVSVVEGNL